MKYKVLYLFLALCALSNSGYAFKFDFGKFNLADIKSPSQREDIPFEPVEIVVQLKDGADASTFRAWLNRKEITDRFKTDASDPTQLIASVTPDDGLRLKDTHGYNINSVSTSVKSHRLFYDFDYRIFTVREYGTTRPTEQGNVVGYKTAENSWAWLGIPYAAAPVDDLRWQAPQAPEMRTSTLETKNFSQACAQLDAANFQLIGGEDCLYLNIWRPQTSEKNLPVYFWIHGGANLAGSADLYNGEFLASHSNMVVVSIQYRLGALGWFDSGALKTGDLASDSGNFGTLDTIAALEWVQNNITKFGGNPDNVTVVGESAGAHNTTNLIMSPLANGLFHRAISQSGGMVTQSQEASQGRTLNMTLQMLVNDGTAPDIMSAYHYFNSLTLDDIETYLRAQSAQQILTAMLQTRFIPGAFQDGHVIPGKLVDVLNSGNYNKVPTIFGSNKDEYNSQMVASGTAVKNAYQILDSVSEPIPSGDYTWFDLNSTIGPNATLTIDDVLPTDADKLLFVSCATTANMQWRYYHSDRLAAAMRQHQDNVYSYSFRLDGDDVDPNAAFAYGAAHAFEIPYFFGRGVGFFPPVVETLPGRVALRDAMMGYARNFAANGNPNGEGLVEWTPWSNIVGENRSLYLDANIVDRVIEMSPEVIDENSIQNFTISRYLQLPEGTRNAILSCAVPN